MPRLTPLTSPAPAAAGEQGAPSTSFAAQQVAAMPTSKEVLIGMGRALAGTGDSLTQLMLDWTPGGRLLQFSGLVNRPALDARIANDAATYAEFQAASGEASPTWLNPAMAGNIAGQVGLAAIPAGAAGSTIRAASTLGGRARALGALGAAENVILNPAESTDPIDQGIERVTQGALGAATGAIFGATEHGIRRLVSRIRTHGFDRDEVRDFTQSLGVDFDQIPLGLQREIENALRQGRDEAEIFNMLRSSGEQKGSLLTAAERQYAKSGEPGALSFQNQLAAGVYGDEAASRVNRLLAARDTVYGERARSLLDMQVEKEANQLINSTTPTDASTLMVQSILERSAALKANEDAAWENLRSFGPDAVIASKDQVRDLINRVLQVAAKTDHVITRNGTPTAWEIASRLNQWSRRLDGASRRSFQKPDPTRLAEPDLPEVWGIVELDDFRKILNANNAEPASVRVLRAMRDEYDNWLAQRVDAGDVFAKPGALDALKTARQSTVISRTFDSSRQNGRFAAGANASAKLIQDVLAGRLNGEGILDRIFLGRNSDTLIAELQQKFADDPAFLAAMRQGAMFRILKQGVQFGEGGAIRINKGAYVSAIEKFYRDHRLVFDALYDAETKTSLNRLLADLRVLSKQSGDPNVKNTSGTAYAMQKQKSLIRDWMLRQGEKFGLGHAAALGVAVDPLTGAVVGALSPTIRGAASRTRARSLVDLAFERPGSNEGPTGYSAAGQTLARRAALGGR